mgnify:CR=1 FL=1
MKNNIIIFIAYTILILLIGLILGYSCSSSKTITKTVNHTDTLYVQVPPIEVRELYPIYIKTRPDTSYRIDSIFIERIRIDSVLKYASEPFIAHFDTTLFNARVQMDFLFPEIMLRNLIVEQKPVKIPLNFTCPDNKRKLYIDIITHTTALGLGFGLGRIK